MTKHALKVIQHSGQKLVTDHKAMENHGQDHSEALELTGIQLSSKAQAILTSSSQAKLPKAWAKALRKQVMRSSEILSKAIS